MQFVYIYDTDGCAAEQTTKVKTSMQDLLKELSKTRLRSARITRKSTESGHLSQSIVMTLPLW